MRIFREIYCFIGWHTWTWKLPENGLLLNGPPPDHAKCEYCGEVYKKKMMKLEVQP